MKTTDRDVGLTAVAGATGTVGSRVATRLAESGRRSRSLVRDLAKARSILGAESDLATVDFAKPATLEAALEGASRLFLVVPDAPGEEKLELEANIVAAAQGAGIQHIVYLSVTGSGRKPEFAFARLHHTTERTIEQSGLAWTHLRPIAFMSNMLFGAETIRAESKFYLPAGDGRVSSIDPDDIASVAVEALTSSGHEGRTYTLTGPEALSHGEQAERLSAVLGRTISYVDVPEAAARDALLNAGVPPSVADDLLEYYALVKAGERDLISTDFEQVIGRRPRSFTEYFERYAESFR